MKPALNHWNVGDIILDLYKVARELGEGGFGKVYQVQHQSWNIDLAMKIPKPQIITAKDGVENFEREAETWVNLGLHPHIVSCYYVRRIESSPLVFAEYVAGGSLRDWIEQRRLYQGGSATSLPRILDIAIQFAWGLHYAHDRGLIHQDVKPANAMLTPEGIVKVTDFGLANARTSAAIRQAQASEGEVNSLRVTGSGAMTPAYCSPEQANRKTLTRRTDLWSWALSILEMFQGEITWRSGVIAAEVLEYYLQTGSSDPYLPQMPIEVASLLRCCFRENPDDRPHDMQEVAAQLQKIYQQVMGSPYPRQQPQAGKDIADSLNNRAVSLLDLGRQNEALQLWQQALQIQPQHLESTYNRGLLLWRTGKIADVTLVRDIEEIRQSYPKHEVVDQLLGWVHLEGDDCEAAIEILSKNQAVGIQSEEAQAALAIAQKRLPDSKRLQRTFEKQTSGVNSICLSADNRLALSGTWKNEVQLWEVTTGKCLRTFQGHKDEVNSVSLSANSQFALSGSDDSTLKLWEVDTGKCLRTFAGHKEQVNSVSLSVDGRFALSGSRDKTLKLWEVDTGKCLRTFAGHKDEVNSVSLSADGRFAVSGSRDKTLKLWEVDTGKCLRTFAGHKEQVNSVCLSSDGKSILSGSDDNTLKLWEVTTGRCLRTFEGETSGVYAVCLSVDSRLALSGSRDNTVKLWEVATGRCLRTFIGHTSLVTSVCLSADGQFALSSEIEDETVKLWKIDDSTTVAPMMLSKVMATEIIISLDRIYEQEIAKAQAAYQQGNYAIAAHHIRQARSQPGHSRSLEALNAWNRLYLNLPRKTLIGSWEGFTLRGHESQISSLCLSADGRFVLSGSTDRTLKLWKMATKSCIRTFKEHKNAITSVSLSLDGCYAISAGGYDRNLKLWEVKTGECLRTFRGYSGNKAVFVDHEGQGVTVTSVCLSADGTWALSGSNNKTIVIWEVPEGVLVNKLEGHEDEVTSICLSADSLLALSGGDDSMVKLWDVTTGECLRIFAGHKDRVNSVCLSVDNRVALSVSRDRTLKIWAIDTGNCVRTLSGHTDGVTSVSLSLDGRYALSGSIDKAMKLWDVRTGQCLRTFEGHTEGVTAVSFSPDGRYAVSGSNDGTLKIWFLDWELEARPPADWDEGARPYLKTFLIQHTPYLRSSFRSLFRSSVLDRSGTPTWTEEDLQKLLYNLGCAGYGWLRREGIEQQLQSMAANWQKPSVVSHHANPSTKIGRGAKEMVEVRSPITSSPANKRSLTNIKKFWILLYFIVIAIIIVAVVFNFSFLAGASVSVVLALLLTWLWVWLSR
jgi:WD40 repeat protein/serine/threonine protein kinase